MLRARSEPGSRSTGRPVIPASSKKRVIAAGGLRPVATVTTGTPLSASRASVGISLRQGAHQVAQKFTTTHCPRHSVRLRGASARSISATSGTSTGTVWTASFRMSPALAASAAAGSAEAGVARARASV